VGPIHGVDDAIDEGGERLGPETLGVRIVEQVVRVATGRTVREGGRDHRVGRGVGLAVAVAQPAQHLLMHAVEDQGQVVDHQEHPRSVLALRDDKGARSLAGVDALGLLIRLAVAQHAAAGGLTRDVGQTASDQELRVTHKKTP
jgi:hypothetical protein